MTLPLRFELVPEIVCGIELSVGGQKLAWNISDYLAGLEEEVTKLLASSEHAGIAGSAAAKPAIPDAATPSDSQRND